MFSAYDRLMATLASVKSASYLFGQFGNILGHLYWCLWPDGSKAIWQLLKIELGPLGLVILYQNVNKLFMSTDWSKLACFGHKHTKNQHRNRNS